MAEEFLDEEEALILLTHEQALAPAAASAANARMVDHGLRRLGQDDARRRARKAPGRATARTCCSSASTAGSATTCASASAKAASISTPSTASASIWPGRPASSCRSTRRARPRRTTSTRSSRTRSSSAIEQPRRRSTTRSFVDEAQDLAHHWLEALMPNAPRSDERASVWLFMDDNQHVYDAKLDVPKEFRLFDLTVNCRNTQAIHREVIKKYAGEVVPESIGPPRPRPRADPHRRPAGGRRGSRSNASAARRRSRRRTSSSSRRTASITRRSRKSTARSLRLVKEPASRRRRTSASRRSAASRDSSRRW